jgi:phosphoesterase RecJ-like protein
LKTLRVNPTGEIAYAFITEEMFHQAKAKREHTDGIIDHIRAIKGIKIAALIIQEGKKLYKVSFRSTGSASVGNLANILGGGGHARAAGATMQGSLKEVIREVIEKAESIISNAEISESEDSID